MLPFRVNGSWRISSVQGKATESSNPTSVKLDSDIFYKVFAGALLLLCYICIKAISWSNILAKIFSVSSLALLSPSHSSFSSNIIYFSLFWSIILIVTNMLGGALRWNFGILLQRPDECSWVFPFLIFCFSCLCRLETTGVKCCFPSFCMILRSLRLFLSSEAT